jgi:aminoglycoside phosphotransferase (APT) family kinase protein
MSTAELRAPPQVIDIALVRRMVDEQFPHWSGIPLWPVPIGWDNNTFRLGERMVVRLPSAAEYAPQVAKEQHWLPKLAPALPFLVPTPLALGRPMFGYRWPWSINEWIEGEVASRESIANLGDFAAHLARFLAALQAADPTGGPPPGPHNFFRGGPLEVYDSEVQRAVALLEGKIDTAAATAVWEAALNTAWDRPPVWVHGDVSPGNLLTRQGRLAAVIDFGALGVGDPASDLSIAWTFFSGESRSTFVAGIPLDSGTWARARGWTLWKALIVAAGVARTNAVEWEHPYRVVEDLLQ